MGIVKQEELVDMNGKAFGPHAIVEMHRFRRIAKPYGFTAEVLRRDDGGFQYHLGIEVEPSEERLINAEKMIESRNGCQKVTLIEH